MTVKQLAKLIAILVVTFGICYGLLRLSNGAAALVFDEILGAFLVVVTLLVTASAAMFNYVENISKELSELRNDYPKDSINNVIGVLSELKREVIYNGGLILFLFVMERAAKGVCAYLVRYHPESAGDILNFSVSLRFAFFCVSAYAAMNQLKGFITATEYRDEIAKLRK